MNVVVAYGVNEDQINQISRVLDPLEALSLDTIDDVTVWYPARRSSDQSP